MVFKQAGQSKLQRIGSSQTKIQRSKWSSNKKVNPSFKESCLLKPRFKDPNGLQTSRSIQAFRNWVFLKQDSRIQMVFKQVGQSKLQGIRSSQTKIQGSKWSSNKQVKESGLLKPRFKDPNDLQTSRSIQASRNWVFSNQDSKIQMVFKQSRSIQAFRNQVFLNQDSKIQMVFR